MKCESTVEDIRKAIIDADRCTGKNLALPVLSHILMTAYGEELTLRATNVSVGIEITVPATVSKEGITLIRGDIVSSFLAGCPQNQKVSFELKDDLLIVSTKTNKISLKTFSHEDFPTLPTVHGGALITLPAEVVVDGIKSVVFSAAMSDIKPEIGSVYLYTEDDRIVFVATDSFRLAEKKIMLKKPVSIKPSLIPSKNALEILRLLDEVSGNVTLTFSDTQCAISYNGTYLTTRLTSGTFPDYTQIIPKNPTTEVILLRQDLLSVLKLSSVFSDKFNQVTIQVDPKAGVTLYAKNTDVGEQNSTLEAAVTGDAVSVNVNQRYLLDSFQAIKDDSVVLQLSGNKPLIIRGVHDTSFVYLVMPMNR